MFKDYYSLAKAGLVYGNLITVIGGFALGSTVAARFVAGNSTAIGSINFALLLATLIGISLVMASGCVFNNYIDRDIDARMSRTKDRALVTKKISGSAAIAFAIVLGVIGFFMLAFFTNALTVAVAAAGFFVYVVLYSLWAKRSSIHGALVGSISGATPPVVGYAAASGRLEDGGALILFAIMVLWQMPHFYAIAIRRADDYAKGEIPVLPVKRGIHATKVAMLLYIIAFIVAASLLTVFGYTGYAYLTITLLLGLAWLALCVKGFTIPDKGTGRGEKVHDDDAGNYDANQLWARKMFFFSLVVMVVLFITITIGAVV